MPTPPLTPPVGCRFSTGEDSALLAGPTAPPAGAVTVNTGDNVSSLTAANPAGTTFWLTSGTHTFTYSVIPKDGNTYIGAPGAVITGANVQAIAFWEEFYGAKAKNVTLAYLTIQNFTSAAENQGSVYAGVGWHISYCTFKNHGYVALFAGPSNIIEHCYFDSNGQLAIGTYRFDNDNYNITVDHNEFRNNNALLLGGGIGGGCKWWATRQSVFTNNWVHHNRGSGVWWDTNNIDMTMEGNYVNDNDAAGAFYEISYNFMIRYNTFVRNALVQGAQLNGNFPVAAVYISEAGGVYQAGYQYSISEIHHNHFENNWDGVALWESGNRYAGTDGPSVAPAYGDATHWRTQNVYVHDNEFRVDKAAIGQYGNPNCGRNGLFGEWVPVPGGHPAAPNTTNNQYQVAVTFNQNNQFSSNSYYGSWAFVGYDATLLFDWGTWQATRPHPPSAFIYYNPAPYGFYQDIGSSRRAWGQVPRQSPTGLIRQRRRR